MDDEKIVDRPINQKRVLLYGVASLVALIIALPLALACLLYLDVILYQDTGGMFTPTFLAGFFGGSILFASVYTIWLSIVGLNWSFKHKCQTKVIKNVLAIRLTGIIGSFLFGSVLWFVDSIYYIIFSILVWLPAMLVQIEIIRQGQDKRLYLLSIISFIAGVILNVIFKF